MNAARQFYWHEIRRRRKARAGKNSFPPTPFLFARPSVRFWFCRAKRGNQSGLCSKKVRAAFSNCEVATEKVLSETAAQLLELRFSESLLKRMPTKLAAKFSLIELLYYINSSSGI